MNRDIGRILIVDNEPNVRLVFRTAMESAGHTVDEAEDGEAALECLRRGGFDLLLLDLQMPGLGGMDVLRRLRDGGDDVPVVVATAHGSIPDAVAAMKLGAIDFLTKPIKPEVLRGVVGDVLRRHARPAAAPAQGHGGADGGADATDVDGLSPPPTRPRRTTSWASSARPWGRTARRTRRTGPPWRSTPVTSPPWTT
jgi:DNA-binding response OmpR family regulator